MWLPKKLYESLPALYVVIGALFLAGVFYVGIDHWLMAAYLAIGVLCVMLGAGVATVRLRARGKFEPSTSRSSDHLFV